MTEEEAVVLKDKLKDLKKATRKALRAQVQYIDQKINYLVDFETDQHSGSTGRIKIAAETMKDLRDGLNWALCTVAAYAQYIPDNIVVAEDLKTLGVYYKLLEETA